MLRREGKLLEEIYMEGTKTFHIYPKPKDFVNSRPNTEHSRAFQAESEANTSSPSNKERPRERWKESAEGRREVG